MTEKCTFFVLQRVVEVAG